MTRSLISFLAFAAIISGVTGYMVTLFPRAAQMETFNQRAIAAGSWKHQAGFGDYAEFTERNP